jgi:hypothetical protein
VLAAIESTRKYKRKEKRIMTTIPVPETPPEPNPYTVPVRAHLGTLRAMSERITSYAEGPAADRRRISYSSNITDDFLERMAAAVEAEHPDSADARAVAKALRDAIAFSSAHEALVDDFELKRKGTLYAIAKVRSDAARLALKGYKIAQLSEQTPEPVPVPHIAHLDSLKRALGRRRRPKVVEPPVETPVETPVAPPKTS